MRARRLQTLIGLLASTGLAARGGARARPPRRRPQGRGAARPRRQAQQAARGAAAPHHHQRAAQLRPARDRRFPAPKTPAFFIRRQGSAGAREELNRTFTQLVREVGLDGRGARKRRAPTRPRHSFAVRTLMDWYQDRRGDRPANCRCSPPISGIMRVILSSGAGLSGHGQPVGDRDGTVSSR